MPIRLDLRLSAIAEGIKCSTAADIGCDHGKLSYYLLQTDRAERVIATDISAACLQKTEKLAQENGVTDRLITRLGDGLDPLKDKEADVVVIAGLGGDVISNVLKRAYDENKCFDAFALSPNKHAEKVRETLLSIGHCIEEDRMVKCGNKFYPVIKSRIAKKTEELTDRQLAYGKFYLSDKVFKRYVEHEIEETERILSDHSSKKLSELLEEYNSVLKEIQGEDK